MIEGQLAERLQAARLAANYRTPEKAAAWADIAAQTLRNIEAGESNPRASTLAALCRIYKVSPAYVLGLSSRKSLR
jgi:transcriptional regulator with XRE-family HTH domain